MGDQPSSHEPAQPSSEKPTTEWTSSSGSSYPKKPSYLPRFILDFPALDSAIATACLRDFTTGPPFPECNEPALNSRITFVTFF
jgi:hypothetical protein